MDRGERQTKFKMLSSAARDRVVDVEKLHVEKNVFSGPPHSSISASPPAKMSCIPILKKLARSPSLPTSRRASLTLGDVERDDHPVARVPGPKRGAHPHLRAS